MERTKPQPLDLSKVLAGSYDSLRVDIFLITRVTVLLNQSVTRDALQPSRIYHNDRIILFNKHVCVVTEACASA